MDKSNQIIGDDFRLYVKDPSTMVYWQGKGTYYFIPKLCVWCRVQCIEVLDDVIERGKAVVFIHDDDVKII